MGLINPFEPLHFDVNNHFLFSFPAMIFNLSLIWDLAGKDKKCRLFFRDIMFQKGK